MLKKTRLVQAKLGLGALGVSTTRRGGRRGFRDAGATTLGGATMEEGGEGRSTGLEDEDPAATLGGSLAVVNRAPGAPSPGVADAQRGGATTGVRIEGRRYL